MAFATSQCISGYPFDDTLQHGESLSPGFDPMVVDAGPNYGPVDFPLINGYAVVDPQFGPGETMQLYYQWGLPSPPPQEFEAHQFDAMEPCMIRPQTGGFPMAPLLNVQAPLAKDPNRTVQKVKFLDAGQEKLHNKQPSQASTKTNKFPCEEDGCGKSFSSGKDLRRHTLSVHTVDQQQYTCRCRFKSPRKDNYLRHLKSRTCSYNSGEPNFICVCGLGSRTRDDIVNHVALCGKRKPGRPAKKKAGSE